MYIYKRHKAENVSYTFLSINSIRETYIIVYKSNAIILFVTYFYPEWISDSDSMELDPVWLSVSVVLSTLLIWTIYKLVSGNKNFKNPIQIQKDEWDIDP